jgi:hypothetical protein
VNAAISLRMDMILLQQQLLLRWIELRWIELVVPRTETPRNLGDICASVSTVCKARAYPMVKRRPNVKRKPNVKLRPKMKAKKLQKGSK